jgi:hypothetical protein
MRLTMQKRPRAFLFQIVTANDRFRQQDGHAQVASERISGPPRWVRDLVSPERPPGANQHSAEVALRLERIGIAFRIDLATLPTVRIRGLYLLGFPLSMEHPNDTHNAGVFSTNCGRAGIGCGSDARTCPERSSVPNVRNSIRLGL